MALGDLIARLQTALGDAYHLERELPAGGMSRLFVATERSLNRQVVIKLLPPEFANESSAARFKREIDVAAHLQHPHILSVLGAGAAEGLLYYVMPFVEGESLRHRLTREGKLPVADALTLLRESADGLAFAHERGIVHRDIKPENILIEAGHAVIADFGIARALAQSTGGQGLTGTGMAMGTPGYMSPEQAAGDTHVDARTDVYALAVVGYEMLAGRPPFEGTSMQAVLAAHMRDTPKALSVARPDVPRAVSAVIMKALAKVPDERFRSAVEFRDALAAAAAPAALPRRPVAIAAAAAIVLAVTAGIFALRGRASGAPDDNVVAVAPFDVLAPDLALWHDGMVDVLSRNLDGMGPLRVVSPTIVVKGWDGRADVSSGVALAKRTGARYAIVGQLQKVGGDSVRASVSVLDARTGASIGEIERRDPAAAIDRLADSLSVAIIRLLPPVRGISSVRLSSLGTRSLGALKEFLQGEQFFRRSEYDSAYAHYTRAVALDTTFALAYRRIGLTIGWSRAGGDPESERNSLKAGTLNHGLGLRDSLLVQVDSLMAAMYASIPSGRAWNLSRRMFATLDTTVALYPRDPEAWYLLGDARYHFARSPRGDATPRQSLEAFNRAIALDSTVSAFYIHPVELAFTYLADDQAGRRYLAEARKRTGAGDFASRFAAAQAMIDARPGESPMADSAPFDLIIRGGMFVRGRLDSAESNVGAARHLRARQFTPSLSPGQARNRLRVLANVLGFRGHAREVLTDSTLRCAGGFAEAAFTGVVPADSLRPAMQYRFDAACSEGPTDVIWWATIGDTTQVRRQMAVVDSSLGARHMPPEFRVMVREFSAAFLALARHDTTEALRHLDTAPDSVCPPCLGGMRLVHAQLLAARGRPREALTLLSGLDNALVGNAFAVLVALERGRVAEKLGEKESAVDAYGFVIDAWRNPDPELRPLVDEARNALKRLGVDVRRRAEVSTTPR